MTWNRFILAPGTSVLSDFELPNPQKADFSCTAKIPTLKLGFGGVLGAVGRHLAQITPIFLQSRATQGAFWFGPLLQLARTPECPDLLKHRGVLLS